MTMAGIDPVARDAKFADLYRALRQRRLTGN